MKYIRLITKRYINKICNIIPIAISYCILVFSVFCCLIILIPSCFDRVPVLSYYISRHDLPMLYELHGKVQVINEAGEIVNRNVEVFVGGYKSKVVSSNFELVFSAPMMKEMYVIIRYEVNGKIEECVKYIEINDKERVISEEFNIYI